MYHKILVPLDGSELAESVLPHVEIIAKGCGVKEVDVITVISHLTQYYRFADKGLSSTEQGYVEELAEKTVGIERAQADKYLDRVVEKMKSKGIKVEPCVHVGDAAEEIASHAEKRGCDLIIIATHGRSGPSRWAYGSVAGKVLRSSCVPVMMVRPQACIPKA